MAPDSHAIDALLGQMGALDASDLHISAGSPPVVRMRGTLQPLADTETLSAEATRLLLREMLSSEQQLLLERLRALDFAYTLPGVARFRVNVFYQRSSLSAAFRLIPSEIRSLEDLGLPSHLAALAAAPRGLILVTGPTGSGKSTTLAALVDLINRTRHEHIITIEDPIEFLHLHKNCIVNQREVGPDAPSFADALRSSLRQDPDVILLGEMRDVETIATALTAAETGHLVLATLHTQSAPQTIDRIIDVFPAAQQEQVRTQLAGTLHAIITQNLVPTLDGRGRTPALEILLPDDAVRNLIRQGKVEQVYSIIQTGIGRGMQTMEQSLADLVLRKVVTREAGFARTNRREQLEGLLERGVGLAGGRPADGNGLRLAKG